MKICILSDQYSTRESGIGLYTKNLVDGLVKRGFSVVLLCKEDEPEELKFDYIKIPTWRIDPSHGKWYSISRNTSKIILEAQKTHGFEIFHSVDARQGAIAAGKLNKIGIPSIGNINDYYFAASPLNPFYFLREYKVDGMKRFFYNHFTRMFERKHLKNFDLLIANSKVTREKVIRAYGLDPKGVIKIYKALGNLQNNRKKPKKKDPFTVSLVGVNLQRKGVFHLIKAIPEILHEFPDTRFEIMGRYDNKMVEECRKLGIDRNVNFYPVSPPEKVAELYLKTDIFILPSLIEGFGMVLLEAMSYGIPCIGTNTGGIKELIKDGETGLLIRPANSKEISDSILHLLRNYQVREKLSRGAFKTSKNFSFDNLLREMIKIYEKF